MKKAYLKFASCIAFAVIASSCTEKADTVIKGRIFTSDDIQPYASQMAIRDGVIVYVGEDASDFISDETEIIEHEGLVTPGFADVHAHGAEAFRMYDLIRGFKRDTLLSIGNPLTGNEPSEEEKEKCILDFQNLLIMNGITCYRDAIVNYPGFDVSETYEKLDKEGKIIVHTYGAYFVDADSDIRTIDTLSTLSTSFKGGNFELNSVKFILDGNIETHSAYLSFVWADDSTSSQGHWPERRLGSYLARANGAGLSFHAHTVGDEALTRLLERGYKNIDRNRRNSAVHLAIVNKDDFKKMRDFNFTAVLTPFSFCKDTSAFDSLYVRSLGADASEKLYPAKTFIESGVRIAYGSDFPASNSLSVVQAVYRMAERKREPSADSTLLWPEQKITVEEALRCVTSGGAYLLGREDRSGSFAVGKQADAVFLDKDITSCPADEIPETKVIRTMMGGKTVYLASDSVR